MKKTSEILCPSCKKKVEDQSNLPFCSSRCKLIDLGAWATESYKVSRPISADDNDDEITKISEN
jgi:endogenous inhibitor of DNA gyrase (YacG/DUF329 family)